MEIFLKRKVSTSESDSGGIVGESSSGNTCSNIPQHTSTPSMPNDNKCEELSECEDLMSQDQSLSDATDILKNDPLLLLKVSISAARYLLKREIPFHVTDESEMSFQSGMFLETVKFIRDQCEIVSEASLQNSEESNRVETLSMQKDIVTCYAQEVLKPILEEIVDDVFALIVDEYSDMSNEKLMSMVLRYVTCGIVKERFVGLIHMVETFALFLKSSIESLFAEYGLSLKKVRGVDYDGANNMSSIVLTQIVSMMQVVNCVLVCLH